MKITKLSLIIIVIIIGVVAIILATNHRSINKSKIIVASPTPTVSPAPVISKYSAELKARVRSEFISNCETKGHYSATECSCAADYLAKNYTESELAKIYYQYKSSSEVSPALEAASKFCLKN